MIETIEQPRTPTACTGGEGHGADSVVIHVGDCLEILRSMPSDSVDCIVTSPPYWGLRDYGVEGQIGLEPDFREYLAKLARVFEECRRVLKPSGTCWVNMGDGYANDGKWGGHTGGKHVAALHCSPIGRNKRYTGFKPKDLIGQPWRLAFALQDAGWYLRSDIIWHKPNPMPESVRDRPTKAHEYLFLLTKSQRYYYDADSIRTELSPETKAHSYETMDFKRREKYKMPDGWDTGEGGHGSYHREGREKGKPATPSSYKGSVPGRDGGPGQDRRSEADREPKGANARTVWTIPTVGFKEGHFATFPPELPKRCILAGCPEGGTVLDPFAGAGTTLMVAKQLGRKWIGIELNPGYAEMARQRIASVTGSLFIEESVA